MLPDNSSCNLDWKCWKLDSGKVLWEYERILKDTGVSRQSKLSHLLKDDEVLLRTSLGIGGLDLSEIVPSRSSPRVTDESQQVFSISTLGLLYVFLGWCTLRSKRSKRTVKANSVELLGGFLGTFLTIPGWWSKVHHKLMERLPGLDHQACPLRFHNQLLCPCLQGCINVLPQDPDRRALVSFLLSLWNTRSRCNVIAAAIAVLMQELSFQISEAISEETFANVASSERLEQGPSGKRLKRVDEVYVQQLTGKRKHRAHTASAYATVTGEVPSSTASHWDSKAMISYLQACSEACSQVVHLCLSVDGSRIGQPAKDTYTMACWSPEVEAGFWLPPQVWDPFFLPTRSREFTTQHSRRNVY